MIRSGSTHQSQKYRVVQGGSIQDRWLLLEFLFWIFSFEIGFMCTPENGLSTSFPAVRDT